MSQVWSLLLFSVVFSFPTLTSCSAVCDCNQRGVCIGVHLFSLALISQKSVFVLLSLSVILFSPRRPSGVSEFAGWSLCSAFPCCLLLVGPAPVACTPAWLLTLSPECFLSVLPSAKTVSDQQTVEVNLLSLSIKYSNQPRSWVLCSCCDNYIFTAEYVSDHKWGMWLEDHTISWGSVRNKLKVAHPISWSSL